MISNEKAASMLTYHVYYYLCTCRVVEEVAIISSLCHPVFDPEEITLLHILFKHIFFWNPFLFF